MTTPKLLSIKHVKYRTSLSAAAIKNAVKAGDFPRPMRLPKGQPVWQESDIEAWIESRPRAVDLPQSTPKLRH